MSTEKRAVLAAILMAVVFVVGQYLMPAQEPAPKPPAEAPATPVKPEAPTPAPKPADSPAPPAPAPTPAPAPAPRADAPRPPQRLATVDTPLYRAVVSSEGGKLQEFVLRYRGEKPLVMLGDIGPAGLIIGQVGQADPVPMEMSTQELRLGAERPSGDVVLTGDADGLRVRETLTFRADGYTIDARIRVENRSGAPASPTITLPWSTRQAWHETKEKFLGQHPMEVVWLASGHVNRAESLCDLPAISTDGAWIAAGSVYYLTAFIPRSGGFRLTARGEDRKICEGSDKHPVGRATVAVQATPTIAPGAAWEGEVVVYAGPKEYDRLHALGLEGTLNFGGFPVPRKYGGLPMEWLGVPILLLMNWVYSYVGSYGVAIILLTVVSKALFYPLTVKSMRSMKAMQTLQPQVNALRNKYKSDPQRLQRETMELYRTHKVNPMGGCLPMLAQVPIFYALYLALSVSVELQGATFLCFGSLFGMHLWICDLASQDPTYVLPLLMGVTMFIQQKMTPVAGDPRQAKMMLLMPVVFTFMFLNLPAGLVLYWTVSNVLQIAQQYYMDRSRHAGAGREVKNVSRA